MVEVKRSPGRGTDGKGLTIKQVADRAGLATSALRFYETQGLISSDRTVSGHRRYRADVLRRVAVIRVAQQLGVPLREIATTLEQLPAGRTPTKADWTRLSRRWRAALDERITTLERLRDDLDSCIGCGCLSLTSCRLYNRDDAAARHGAGPRYLYGDATTADDPLTARAE